MYFFVKGLGIPSGIPAETFGVSCPSTASSWFQDASDDDDKIISMIAPKRGGYNPLMGLVANDTKKGVVTPQKRKM